MKNKKLILIGMGIVVLIGIGIFLTAGDRGKIESPIVSEKTGRASTSSLIQYSKKIYIDPALKGKIEVITKEESGPQLSVVMKSKTEETYIVKLFIDWKDAEGKIIKTDKWCMAGICGVAPTITDYSGDRQYFAEGAYDYQVRIKLLDPASYSIKGSYRETPEIKGKIVLLKKENFYEPSEHMWKVKYMVKNISRNEAFSIMSCWEYWTEEGKKYEEAKCFELPDTLHPGDEILDIKSLDPDVIAYQFYFKIKSSFPSYPKTVREIMNELLQVRTPAEIICSDEEEYDRLCSRDNQLNYNDPTFGNRFASIRDKIYQIGGKDLKCYAKGGEYCLEVKLSSGEYFCLDSSGGAKMLSAPACLSSHRCE